MKQRIAGYQNSFDEASHLIAEAADAGTPKVLHIFPSTLETLKSAADWASKARWHIVGLRDHFGPFVSDESKLLTPPQFLTICKETAASEERRHTVIFTDQFVSAEFAPVLVQQGTQQTFYPSLEVVAAARYGLALSYWNGTSFSSPVISRNYAEILGVLKQYYEACEALGESWLMRKHQYQRTLAGRIEIAKYRLRFYQSIVMLSAVDNASIQVQIALLEDLISVHHLLPRSSSL